MGKPYDMRALHRTPGDGGTLIYTEAVCASCGKAFRRTKQHAWKLLKPQKGGSSWDWFCGYNCMRAKEREREARKKERLREAQRKRRERERAQKGGGQRDTREPV